MIQIVDDKDQLIGHKNREDVNHDSEIYRVAALWLTNSKGEVLIAQRKLTKDKDPGVWGPAVSGTVEEGETYETNIYKEAEEEIGLTGVGFNSGPKMRVNEPRNYFCQWFTAVVNRLAEDFRVQEEEVEQIKWMSERELIEDVKAHPDKYIPVMPQILKIFQNYLSG